MIDDSIADLLGEEPPPKKKRGRPKKKPEQAETESREEDLDIRDVYAGVSTTWLMNAFRMDRSTVKRKLAPLPPIKYERANMPIYDFVQAASYLVKPRVDIAEYIRTLKPNDLPNDLQKEYWDAQLKRQTFELKSGQLWRTEDVLETFGEVFKRIKTTMQLWVENIERKQGLSADQRTLLVQMVDGLQNDIHEQLIDLAKTRSTPSSRASENTTEAEAE